MNVQTTTSTSLSVSPEVWKPIRFSNSSIRDRMQVGRLVSRQFANAVMFGLLRNSVLPAELIREAAEWLMVIDRETRGRGVGIIRRLGADFDLGLDHRGRALDALFGLKTTIDHCAFSNAAEARQRGLSWTSHLFGVEEGLRRKLTEVSAKLTPALSSAIEKKLSELEEKIDAEDWGACCEIMTALDHLVSDELVETPSASHVG